MTEQIDLTTMIKLRFLKIFILLLLVGARCCWAHTYTSQQNDTVSAQSLIPHGSFTIQIEDMNPMSYPSRMVSYGYSLSLSNDMVTFYLPYMGEVYQPEFDSSGLNMTKPVCNYTEKQGKKECREIRFTCRRNTVEYRFHITLFKGGTAYVNLQPSNAQSISYSGSWESVPKEKVGVNEQIKAMVQHGDLLFNIHSRGSEFGDAIVAATKGNSDININHVAIVVKEKDGIKILEATGKHGVWICPIDTFLSNAEHSPDGKPLVLIGRLKDDSNVKQSVKRAKQYLGRPYDWVFSDTEEAIYCSELVHLSYLDKEGNHIFPQQPMSFHDQTGTILPYWTEYYKKKGMEVPEGKPGTNPSDLSKSERLEIIDNI